MWRLFYFAVDMTGRGQKAQRPSLLYWNSLCDLKTGKEYRARKATDYFKDTRNQLWKQQDPLFENDSRRRMQNSRGMSEDSVAKSCSRHRQSNAKADKCKQIMFHVKHCLCFYLLWITIFHKKKRSNTPKACWRRNSRIGNHIADVSRETLRGTSGSRSDQETGGRLLVVYSCSANFYCGLLLRSVQ